jgi:hypothetical protein
MMVHDTAIKATQHLPPAAARHAPPPQAPRQCRTLLQEDAGHLREVFASVGVRALTCSDFTFDESFGADDAGGVRVQSGRVLALVNPLRVAALTRSIGLDAASMFRFAATVAVAGKIGVSLCTRGVGINAGARRLIAECGGAEVYPAGALLFRLRALIFDRPAQLEQDLVEALLRSIGRLVPRSRLFSLLRLRCNPVELGRRSIAQVASAARMSPGSSLATAFDGFVAGRGIAAADLTAFRQLIAADYLAELRRRLALQQLGGAV